MTMGFKMNKLFDNFDLDYRHNSIGIRKKPKFKEKDCVHWETSGMCMPLKNLGVS